MRQILITGSNRGIGLELVRQYLQGEDIQVFATCRNPDLADELQALVSQHADRAKVVRLDVIDQELIQAAVTQVSAATDRLDIMFNNAGINPKTNKERNFGTLDAEAMLHVLRVNSVAPVMLAQAFADLLRHGSQARLINLSSGAGSITSHTRGCDYVYNASKAALNMFTGCLAGSLGASGVIVIALNPGWVRTDMGGPNARLDPPVSIRGIIQVVDGLTQEHNGRFLQWDGKELPW